MLKGALITEYSETIDNALCGDEILYACCFDLSEDGMYTEGIIAVGTEKLCVIENGKITYVRNICDIEKLCCGEYVGAGMVEEFSNKA